MIKHIYTTLLQKLEKYTNLMNMECAKYSMLERLALIVTNSQF